MAITANYQTAGEVFTLKIEGDRDGWKRRQIGL